MEMGFATAGDVMNVAERVARRAVEASIAAGVLSREALDDAPFPIMNYADALNRFGSDKVLFYYIYICHKMKRNRNHFQIHKNMF